MLVAVQKCSRMCGTEIEFRCLYLYRYRHFDFGIDFFPNFAPEIFQCHKLQTPRSGGRPPIKQLRNLERHRIEVEWNLWKIVPRKWNWCLLKPDVVFDFTEGMNHLKCKAQLKKWVQGCVNPAPLDMSLRN